MTQKMKNNQNAYYNPVTCKGYPSFFCVSVVENETTLDDFSDEEDCQVEVLHRLRLALRQIGFSIECELGEYVLLDTDDGKVFSGNPEKIARYCLHSEILDLETYHQIISDKE